jgi:hypothetical protein
LGVADGAVADFSAGFVAPAPAAEAGGFEGTGAFGSSGIDIRITLRLLKVRTVDFSDAMLRHENLYDARQ